MLLWQREALLFRQRRLLLVEHVASYDAIRLRTQEDECERAIAISLVPAEGGEATRSEVSVAVAFPRVRFWWWFLLLLLQPGISWSIMRALQLISGAYGMNNSTSKALRSKNAAWYE